LITLALERKITPSFNKNLIRLTKLQQTQNYSPFVFEASEYILEKIQEVERKKVEFSERKRDKGEGDY